MRGATIRGRVGSANECGGLPAILSPGNYRPNMRRGRLPAIANGSRHWAADRDSTDCRDR
jgi:hypothetical protein